MSEVSMSAQQLAQALAQLNKAAATSPLAKQAMDVLVKQVTQSAVFLADPRTQRPVQIPKTDFQGRLIDGGQYQTKLTGQSQAPRLSFISNDPSATILRQLTSLSASNLSQLMQQLDTQSALLGIGKAQNSPATLPGTVTRVTGNQVTVQFTLNGKPQQATFTVPQALQKLSQGQAVTLNLAPTKTGWEVSLLLNNGVKLPVDTNAAQSQTLLKAAVQSPTTPQIALAVPKQALVQALNSASLSLPKSVINQILATPFNNLVLEKSGRQWSLSSQDQKVVASLSLDPPSLKKLSNLGIDLSQLTKQPISSQTQNTGVQTNSPQMPHSGEASKASSIPADSMKAAIEQLLRRLEPQQVSPSQSLNRLSDILKPLAQATDSNVGKMVSNILKELRLDEAAKSPPEVRQIQQLLTHPSQVVTPSSISSPPPSGVVGGLIALLQVTLASRLMRQQPLHSERLQQVVSQIVSARTGQTTVTTTRNIQDFNQQEQRTGLLRDLMNLLSNHQSHKLASAEQNLQGQDSFYYVIPSAFGDAAKDIELLIRREQDKHSDNKKGKSKQKSWHLTMKLSVGEHGEMLTKARLTDTQLEIDFYTSKDGLKILILEHLPLLKKRLASLGIELGDTQCQLGKIPDTLKERPYRIFETQA